MARRLPARCAERSAERCASLGGLGLDVAAMERVHAGDRVEPSGVRRADESIVRQRKHVAVGVGSAVALWPFIDQMNPNKGTPGPEVKEVDLNLVAPGQTITVPWRGMPIVIRIGRVRRSSWLGAHVSQSFRIGWPVTKHCRGLHQQTMPIGPKRVTTTGWWSWASARTWAACSNRRKVLLQSLRVRVGSVPVMPRALTCRGAL